MIIISWWHTQIFMMVRWTKFQVSISICYKVMVNYSRKYRDPMSGYFLEKLTWRSEWVSDGQSELYRSFTSKNPKFQHLFVSGRREEEGWQGERRQGETRDRGRIKGKMKFSFINKFCETIFYHHLFVKIVQINKIRNIL